MLIDLDCSFLILSSLFDNYQTSNIGFIVACLWQVAVSLCVSVCVCVCVSTERQRDRYTEFKVLAYVIQSWKFGKSKICRVG